MYKYEILTQLLKYKGKDRDRFHVPGHKDGRDFKSRFPVAPIDVTELSFSDDLSCPDGVIKKAQSDLAEIVGAKRAYITTDGSSSGVMAMLFVAQAYGNKIIVPRNSHKSVFNACRLLNVEPVIVQGREEEGVILPPEPELIETLLANDVNIAGMIIASPDYYGTVANLEEYSAVLKNYDRFLFVDGAHGAHLFLDEDRALYAGRYADMWVDGSHKTMPTLTQGALVCVGNEQLIERAEEALGIFRTTSPSYPVMASVEYGIKFLVNNPKYLARARQAVSDLRVSLQTLKAYPSDDWTKYAVDFKPLGISPRLAQEYLEKRGIYPEMNDGRYVLFYFSPMTEPKETIELRNALLKLCTGKKYKNTYKDEPRAHYTERTYSFLYAYKNRAEWVPLSEAVGRMCAENAGVVPPCFPTVIAGEMITEEAVAVLSSARSTFGISEGKIKAVKQ